GQGTNGGVMMYLADSSQLQELRLKGSSAGRDYIGPAGRTPGTQDREIVSFDGRVMILKYVDPEIDGRYGTGIFVRCAPRAAQAIPVGFGGLEIFGSDALLRSLVTLPPLRQVGMGAAMVTVLETEARALKCRVIYLLTASDTRLFGRLGYAACARSDVPEAVRASRQF